ncbi:hypothetical protein ACIPSE_30455 [Streptomyces sp. NPDC090106]|uniref:hypothetical protein n=1 Tax=Streptomyces sp. NPDC090106 TaxID=3365946 RepID=UPI0037F5C1A8
MQGRPGAWREVFMEPLRERGAIGVRGVFRELIRGSEPPGFTSVYVEFAHRRGWLAPDRVLDTATHDALLGRVREWAAEDRTWPDVVAEFGEPCVLLGEQPVLWAVQLGDLPFGEAFTVTPAGRRLRPAS